MAKTKFFRVAVEGATAYDGRVITADWINQSAAGYNTAAYTARINCEHIKGFSPEPPFNAYGSVLALTAGDYDLPLDGKVVKRRALFAQLDANDQMIATVKADQKIFTSCEFAPDFAKTGKAGLVGLAITDNPASLGTEALNFSALKPMWQSRLTDPANFFTPSEENKFELETPAPEDPSKSMFAAATDFFKSLMPKQEPVVAPPVGVPPVVVPPAGPGDAMFAGLLLGIEKLSTATENALDGIRAEVRTFSGKVTTIETQLSNEQAPNRQPRNPAMGGGNIGNFTATDC